MATAGGGDSSARSIDVVARRLASLGRAIMERSVPLAMRIFEPVNDYDPHPIHAWLLPHNGKAHRRRHGETIPPPESTLLVGPGCLQAPRLTMAASVCSAMLG